MFKRLALYTSLAVIVAAGAAAYALLGHGVVVEVRNGVSLVQRTNLLSQIGANVVVYSHRRKTVIVDTQLPFVASLTRSQINALARGPISAVIVTHWHPDHSGGIEHYSAGSRVIAHKSVLSRLSAPQEGFGLTRPGSHHQFDARKPDAMPNEPIDRRLELSTGDATVEVIHHASAHTDGDLVVYFHGPKVVALGDLIWPGSFPFIDLHNGGTAQGLENALEDILERTGPMHVFVPGHGEPLNRNDVFAYREMVTATRTWVTSQAANGLSLNAMIEKGLPPAYRDWASALVPEAEWIRMIHDSKDHQIDGRMIK